MEGCMIVSTARVCGGGKMKELAENIFAQLGGESELVFKSACGGFQGKGVRLLHVTSPAEVLDFINTNPSSNYVLQKRIVQHPFFNQFNSSSSNIIRVISWRDGEEIRVLSTTIRYGIEGSFTDVAFVNGKEVVHVVGIDKSGRVNERHFTGDGLNPTPPRIVTKEVPSYEKLVSIVKKAHADLMFFDFVAWDYMIDKDGEPVCIEFNILGPGTTLYQFANGPLAGEYTTQFLDFLKNETVQIPRLYRA